MVVDAGMLAHGLRVYKICTQLCLLMQPSLPTVTARNLTEVRLWVHYVRPPPPKTHFFTFVFDFSDYGLYPRHALLFAG